METPKKIWLVGASHGIGRALSIELANRGHSLALSARTQEDLVQLKDQLSGQGHLAIALDVKDEQTIAHAQSQILDQWGYLDVVIFAAGIYRPMSFQDMDAAFACEILDVNTLGALRLLGQILPYYKKRGYGHVAVVGSIAGYTGLPHSCGYGISKAAIIHMMECLRADISPDRVKVQLFSPGFVKTRLTDLNPFEMPDLITAEEAAVYIADGLNRNKFEIYFPKRFPLVLKFFRLLPYALYFKCISLLRP